MGLPWRGYPREWVLIALVALAALGPVYADGWPDVSRLALTQAIVDDHSVQIDRWQAQTGDKSIYKGHVYSDKAPGISFVALVPFQVFRWAGVIVPPKGANGVWYVPRGLWIFRLLTGGLFFLIGVFVVGRVAEGLRAGTGALSAATFGVGTMALPLAATVFGHIAAGVLCLGGFLLLWRRGRWGIDVAAGACAGTAVLVEYQAVVVVAVLLVYLLATRRSAAAAARFVMGGIPAAVILGAYDWAAFGSPFRLSYRYVSAQFATQQREDLFGIGWPHWHSLWAIPFDSTRGLVVTSPVLVLALAGLVLLWREGRRAEAATCLAVTAALLLMDAGYFEPFGGVSPGPRFFAPALPFLALGLPLAFAAWARLTATLALVSLFLLAPLTTGWRVGGGSWWDRAGGSMTWFMRSTSRSVVTTGILVLGAAALGYAASRRAKTIGAASASIANAKK
jgi:uncharacterized membrane protein